MFPERFSNLPAYAFPRLRSLLDHHEPGGDVVHMTIGEPKHTFPDWVSGIIAENAAGFNKYPPNDGTPELQGAIADWLKRRFGADVDASSQVMALNGTREGLYNACIALSPESKNGKKPVVLMPNRDRTFQSMAASELSEITFTLSCGFFQSYRIKAGKVL